MRTLLLLRGAPGSGKSTFIKENNLENYTLEADKFRLLITNPVLTESGFTISQQSDGIAWNMLLQCLEERMKKGDFTVIDATHSSRKLCKRYQDLADKYKYTCFYYQLDTSLEDCIINNRKRAIDNTYKYVPEQAIERIHALIESTELTSKFKRIYDVKSIMNFYTDNITDKYKEVFVIGDIHSCNTVLKIFLDKHFDPNNLYVFLGDYFDRGIEHKETFNTLYKLSQDYPKNIVFIEGNHDTRLYKWSSNIDYKFNYTFDNVTLPALLENENVEDFRKKVKLWCKSIRQAYAFEFHGRKYLCTHGGLTQVPDLTTVSTDTLIRGVGDYDTEVAKIYDENFERGLCQDFIQIHGHRGVDSGKHSYCLESEVEFGGELSYLHITQDGHSKYGITNPVFDKKIIENSPSGSYNTIKVHTDDSEVNILCNSRLVKVKAQEPNLYSVNFKEKVFFKKLWDLNTIKARGLFVDRTTGEVKLRAYDKFFNYNENKYTFKSVIQNLSYPLRAVRKENGYLGLLSWIDSDFIFATKSVTSSELVDIFKKIFYSMSDTQIECFRRFFSNNPNVTITFEVVSLDDPHIVEYTYDRLYLLDIVPNKLHLDSPWVHLNVEASDNYKTELNDLFIEAGLMLPWSTTLRLCATEFFIESFGDLITFFEEDVETNTEGYVFIDNNGFMFKYKNDWYSNWKRMRSLLGLYQSKINENFGFHTCRTSEDVHFMKYITSLDKDVVANLNIIEARTLYYKATV